MAKPQGLQCKMPLSLKASLGEFGRFSDRKRTCQNLRNSSWNCLDFRANPSTDPALAAARRPHCPLFANPYLGRRVMAASKVHPNGKPKKTRTKSAETKAKKLSALDAAAQVLAETGQFMNCKEMIEAMAQKGYLS